MPLDTTTAPLLDGLGRRVTYLRLSVTDRCDLRCTYCMAEKMCFLPRREVLTLEEMDTVASWFVAAGVRKLRLTGGEPLVRPNVLSLVRSLSRHLDSGALDELTLTTNGTQLARHAAALAACGVRRVNVSLDTLEPARYRAVTRLGDISKVLAGLDAAQAAGLRVKLNAVASRGAFEAEVDDLIRFAHGRDMDLTLIEEMPLGETGADRAASALPLDGLRRDLAERWTLTPAAARTGGPARMFRVAETGGLLGFIAPMSCNFCALCNRVRLGCTGRLYTCLGDEGSVDLRAPLREGGDMGATIRAALRVKPAGHRFDPARMAAPSVARHMSVLGG